MLRRLALLTIFLFGVGTLRAAEPKEQAERRKAYKLQQQGNFKEAYDVFRKLLLNPKSDPQQVSNDFNNAYNSLRRLNRVNETDELREAAVKAHAKNWRLLHTVAQNYMNNGYHYGFMVAGEFRRGPKRGGQGKVVNSYERDRVRSLQLMQQALPFLEEEPNRGSQAGFYASFSRMMLGNRGYTGAWRLQYKTDLSELPDYEDGYGYHYRYRGRRSQHFAPVDENNNPVFHKIPKSFKDAKSDGERWRYLLMMRMELNNAYRQQVNREYADFLLNQFGVQTMAGYNWWGNRGGGDDDAEDREGGILTLHTLKDDETVARLATGIKRFELPAEHNFVRIFKELGDNNQHGLSQLRTIYLNRRQYDRAVPVLRRLIAVSNGHTKQQAERQLDQILKNWGMFEAGRPQPAGKGATVGYRFRNGKKVDFTAYPVKVDKLLDDLKAYLKSNPKKLDWNKVNIGNIGYRLVYHNQQQYVGPKTAEWSLALKPRERHFDRRINVTTPLQKAGAYLLEGRMENGNVTRIIIWIADTVIARKQMQGKTWYYVADAVTGVPVADAKLDFFGYRQEYLGNRIRRKVTGRRYNVYTHEFAETSDRDGQVHVTNDDVRKGGKNFSWVAIARKEGRLAFLGFNNIWQGHYNRYEYHQRKTYAITDRPVYRPSQKVKFKFWTSQVRYDVDDVSQYAGRTFNVRINNPKGEKIYDKPLKADQYGGFQDEFELPQDATLGQYYIYVHRWGGGIRFRVEEYKKPEFEVKVEAPTEPVMLGEKIPVKVQAKYYFGAPVVNAKVKLKVTRTDHNARWYPSGIWDWFYGPGYWWFAYDYPWYPGWHKWGCRAPIPWWWHQRSTPPEVVMQKETFINPDGTVDVTIDSSIARELHGDTDHRYQITAEVVDESRRTIVGTGQVLVARAPFKVYAWLDRGHYNAGDTINASFSAQTIANKPVQGKGVVKLMKVSYAKDGKPIEKPVKTVNLDTDEEGRATLKLEAAEGGQYRLSYTVTDAKGHSIEGGYMFVIRDRKFDGGDFHFSKLELIPDKREYAPGETVKLLINVDKRDTTVALFVRPVNGAYLPPEFLRLDGKSAVHEITVTKADMPNFFVEGLTIYDGRVHSVVKEIVVPPEKRVLNVTVTPSKKEYKPGEKAKVKVLLTDLTGEPYEGSVVMSIYDKAVEYISGGSNVAEIKNFFWKWRRRHNANTYHSLARGFHHLLKKNQLGMQFLGAFGYSVADMDEQREQGASLGGKGGGAWGGAPGRGHVRKKAEAEGMAMDAAPMKSGAAPMANAPMAEEKAKRRDGGADRETAAGGEAGGEPQYVEAAVRSKFADTAYWNGAITTGRNGEAEIELTMPENLTGWKVRTWALGKGPRVGESTVEVVTTKNLLLRLQAPRFFVEKDEVVLSANVHNYLKTAKKVKVILEVNECLQSMENNLSQLVEIEANGEKRVDWRMKVVAEGSALVRMKALTDEESDGMEMRFPSKVHGFMKTVSFSGHMRPDAAGASVAFTVPKERRPEQSLLEVRYSPTLAGAMVDALPYLVSYPYGCTEQTLNRFIPTVITQKILIDMGIDLADVQKKRTNLNAQEIGDDKERAKQWKRGAYTQLDKDGKPIWNANPVFDHARVQDMVKTGVTRLTNMQLSDGGWGWFSGFREHSYPHTTATVVHGLQLARANDVRIPDNVLNRGIGWLTNYQKRQVRALDNAASENRKRRPWKSHADNLDAFVFMVLTDAGVKNEKMQKYLYRDRNKMAVYGKCMMGIAFHKLGLTDQVAMIKRNIEQFLVKDAENQTAYLKLGNGGYWWYWYGSEYEAHAYYLKLLAKVEPKGNTAPWMVKYLLNNRKHATYWNSTRDTAICIEAFADYMRASEEDKPDMTLEVYLDGKKHKEVQINKSNIFSFDNRFMLAGKDVTAGNHKLEFKRKGKGPLYFNTYVSYFSLEDHITKAGLEIKVNRKYFKLIPVDKTIKVAGSRGQALDQKVEKFEREEIKNLGTVKSGDLLEIELTIESKNDYEYIIFEDLKAAGCEPYKVKSGYTNNGMHAYMELRDDRVSFFVRWLPRGKHSIAYRMRAEIPGKFSALPTKAYAMYAPELRGNSDEIKINIEDVGLMRKPE